jgi:hypothetical protein
MGARALDRIAAALEALVAIERAREERAARRKGPRPVHVHEQPISDTDRALARQYARQLGMVVKAKR